MKISTSFFCLFSFLIFSSILGGESKKGLIDWVVAGATKATSSAIKGVNPLPYALDKNNAAFYTSTVKTLQGITIEQFRENVSLQNNLRSLSSRNDRANHCIVDAVTSGNATQILDLCKANGSNIHPEVFKLVLQYFKEQQQDTTVLGITPSSPSPVPVPEQPKLIHSIDIAKIEKTTQLSQKVIEAINTNHIEDLKNILDKDKAYLPEWVIAAATIHLTQIQTTIATVISPHQVQPVDSMAQAPADASTQTASNMPLIVVSAETILSPVATATSSAPQTTDNIKAGNEKTLQTDSNGRGRGKIGPNSK